MLNLWMVVLAAICLGCSRAHFDQFKWDVGVASRPGKATLNVKPDPMTHSTVFEFTTMQEGVMQREDFRVAFQFLNNLVDNSSSHYESVVFQFKIP